MSSPFIDEKLAKAIVINGPAEVVDFEYKGIKSVLGMYNIPAMRNLFKLRILYTPYEAFLKITEEYFDIDNILKKIDEESKVRKIDRINLKLGFADESVLNPRLSKLLLDSYKRKMKYGFCVKKRDVYGLVDLSVDFKDYLKGLKSGYREYYNRGINRNLYEIIVRDDLTREVFDNFIFRVKMTYKRNNYGFKWSNILLDSLFECFKSGKAKLIEVKAYIDKNINADILILHDGKDAFYYSGSRSIGTGVYNGIAHFAQIYAVKHLKDIGFESYNLGSINREKGSSKSDIDVKEFKYSFCNTFVPLVHIFRENFKSKLYFFYRNTKDKLIKIYE